MPPLTSTEMSERRQGFEVDIERQAIGENADQSKPGVPTLVLTVPNQNRNITSKAAGNFLPLPSSQYRYTKWHDIDCMEVKGSMLRSPRIRRAPKGYNVSTIHEIGEEIDNDHQTKSSRGRMKNKRRLNYQSKLESWETCEAVNLSFQELGDPYQLKQFLGVLQKLIRCENLQLIDNGLKDLNNIYLPRCKFLYLQRNFMSNLKKLPRTPCLTHLSLQQNNIQSLHGLSSLRRTKLVSLTLQGNPVELDPHYRKNVFQLIPSLRILDGIPRLKEDTEEYLPKTCIIS